MKPTKTKRVASKMASTDEAWESGRLGCDESSVRVAGPELESLVDESLGLQAISIRLPRHLIEAYKLIAAHHGVGYQPLMRDILQRFVPEGLKEVLQEHEMRAEAASKRIAESRKAA